MERQLNAIKCLLLYFKDCIMNFKWKSAWKLLNLGTLMLVSDYLAVRRFAAMRVIIACCFRVTALSGHAALALSPGGIALELNRIQLSAIDLPRWAKRQGYRSIYWQKATCRLVIPLRQVALAQLYKYHHQSGNAASGKLVWKQHKDDVLTI